MYVAGIVVGGKDCNAFFSEDCFESRQSALVHRTDGVTMGKRVGERVHLELKADLDDV